MSELSHVNKDGQVNMVDVGDKNESQRIARAEAFILMSSDCLQSILDNNNKKGDVIATAKIAGIMAAKRCADLIPLCHPLMLSKVSIDIEIDEAQRRLRIISECKLTGKTGVEMEALTAVNVAALTIFDMCKAIDAAMQISGIRVLEKFGGKTGHWYHPKEANNGNH